MLNLLVLRCKNSLKTKAFYEKLGFVFVEEQHGCGPVHFSTELDGLTLELYPASQSFPVDACRLGFTFANFIELSHLMNVKITQRKDNDFFILVDPDGRKIEVTKA